MGPRMTVLYEQGWGSGDYFAFSSPKKKKKKLEGGGENSHPHFLPRFPRKDPGQGGQGEGAGRSGPIAVNRSRPPPGPLPSLAAFPSTPRSPTPSCRSPPPQARPGREAGAALPPHRPHRGRLGPGSPAGGGAGVPCRRILPRGWRRGGGDGNRGMED